VAIVVSIVYAVWQTVAITIEPTPSGLSSKPVVKAVPKIDPVAAPAAAPRAAPPAPQVSKNKGPILVYPYQPITATFNRPTPVSKSAATGKPAKPQSETEATMNALNQYLKL
ncbi:MAG: hypothetical protein N2690_13070, partial [Rhodocyclaceae bacterium]|nr:hypothetical protein [Rhodocyclaceae bacterium]